MELKALSTQGSMKLPHKQDAARGRGWHVVPTARVSAQHGIEFLPASSI